MRLDIPTSDLEVHSFSWLPETIDARMYLLRSGEDILCIDPSCSEEARILLTEWNAKRITVAVTHEHFDHCSGVNFLREAFDCNVVCTKTCGVAMQCSRKNLSEYAEVLLCTEMTEKPVSRDKLKIKPFVCCADTTFEGTLFMMWGKYRLDFFELGGHSAGSMCIVLDEKLLFSGDNLIPGKPAVTKLPGGSKTTYENVVRPWLEGQNKELYVLPGHFDGDVLERFILKMNQ